SGTSEGRLRWRLVGHAVRVVPAEPPLLRRRQPPPGRGGHPGGAGKARRAVLLGRRLATLRVFAWPARGERRQGGWHPHLRPAPATGAATGDETGLPPGDDTRELAAN